MKLYDSNGKMVELPERTFGDNFGVGAQARAANELGYIDPKGAAWGQALNNIARMNMGQAPEVSPVTAYQQAILSRSTQSQQRKMNDLTIQQAEQDLDAFYDYKTAKREGIIPPTTSYAEFKTIENPYRAATGTTNARDMETYQQLLAQDMQNNTNYAPTFLEWKRASRYIDTGGGGVGRVQGGSNIVQPVTYGGSGAPQAPPRAAMPPQVSQAPQGGPPPSAVQGGPAGTPQMAQGGPQAPPPQGQMQPLAATSQMPQGAIVNPQQQFLDRYSEAENNLEYGKSLATQRGQNAEEISQQVRQFAYGLPQAESTIARNNEIIRGIKAGSLQDSGPLAGFVKQLYDPEFAALQAESIYNTLLNLQITKLTPVSNEEVKLVSQMWASAFRGGKVNIAILEEANRRTQQMIDVGQKAINYYQSNVDINGNPKPVGSMEGYGMGGTTQATPSPTDNDQITIDIGPPK